MRILRDAGANVLCYLTRTYGHFPPSIEGLTFDFAKFPTPVPLIKKHKVDFVLPMSIDWAQKEWTKDLLNSGVPVVCPTGEALKLERERDLARVLCERFKIPFPRAYFASDLNAARRILKKDPRPYVIKNPLCGPTSPIHTIVCEDKEDTLNWLPRLDFGEGVFLQEYLGRAEAGHFAFVSGGEIHSLATNQEYKRAFHGNQGVVAGAPLGGLVECDPADQYGLARELLHPLLPWFRETKFHGPVQVTAMRSGKRWHVLEYNVRLGVTSGAMILRMLENAPAVLQQVARNEKLKLEWRPNLKFGCSITLAGFGYPYTQINGPQLPLKVSGKFDCDVWWNEVKQIKGKLFATGHRIADVVAIDSKLDRAIERAYRNMEKLTCLASYYREDIGQSLWPPGSN
jgi:phosphoribosylamine-glycine ligase